MKNFLTNTIHSQKVFFRYYRRKGFRRFVKENILETDGTPKTKALSVALGVSVGLSPLWGFHTVVVLFLASIFKLNKVLSYMCTHISAPPFIPFLIAGSLFLGAPFVKEGVDFRHMELNFSSVREHIVQYLVGSIILAVLGGVVTGFFSYFIFRINNKK